MSERINQLTPSLGIWQYMLYTVLCTFVTKSWLLNVICQITELEKLLTSDVIFTGSNVLRSY